MFRLNLNACLTGLFGLTASLAFAQGTLSLNNIVTSGTAFTRPVAAIPAPGDSRIYVVEQQSSGVGRIRHVTTAGDVQSTATPFFSIPVQTGFEQGLLGLAFHPNYAVNRFFYVYYTASPGKVIARYTASADGNSTVAGSARTIMTISEGATINNNGGTIRFGPDGFLYIGMGDGGSNLYPQDPSQSIDWLLGKFLRINVDADDFPLDANKNYAIPADNPYVGVAGRDEIWSIGWRNPWKWAFDPRTMGGFDGLTVADVGYNTQEELDYERPGDKGLNYGWRTFEGTFLTGWTPYNPPYATPFYTYNHQINVSAVTGGVVYRGVRLGPTWWGRYVFCEYGPISGGNLWTIPLTIDGDTGVMTAGAMIPVAVGLNTSTTAIEVDAEGELLVSNHNPYTQVGRLVGSQPWRAISGTIQFQGLGSGSPAPNWALFEFLDANNNPLYSLNVGLPPSGTFRLPAPNGAFKLSVKHKNWLRRTIDVTTATGDVSGASLSLINGDADGDNAVTPSDYGIWALKNGLTQGDAGFDELCDFDRDGAITPSDYGVWAVNNGSLGDD